MYLTHATLSRELYYFWELVFPRNLIIVESKTNYWHILTLRKVLWTIRVVLPWKNSVKDPNKEHNFFNKSRCSWWRIVNFSCHSIGASNLEFIVWRYRKKKNISTDTFSNAYNDTKIIYNKVVRTEKFDAGCIV